MKAAVKGSGGKINKNSPPPLAGGGWGEGADGTSLLAHARSMRRAPTPAERKLWQGLRKHQLIRLKFRRQVPIGPFIADFACKQARLVIETDGDQHGTDEQELRDAKRTEWLQEHGWRVLRFWNSELAASMDDALTHTSSS